MSNQPSPTSPDQPTVELFLDDAKKSKIFGIPSTSTTPIENPFFHATELDKANRYQEAEAIYLELLNAHFGNPVLCAALGMNYAATGKNGLAALLLQHALDHRTDIIPSFKQLGVIPKLPDDAAINSFNAIKHSEILNALGTCYKHENHVPEARNLFLEAQSYVPPNADIQNNLGTLYINEGKPTEALEILDKAVALNPEHPQARWNRALAYLELGDYERGWPEYDYGFPANVRMDRNYTKDPLPTWNGEKGANVVVFGEQGIGDEILFASMLPDLIRDCNLVVFDCHKKLHTLFCNSFPNLDIFPTREDPQLKWPLKQDGTPRYPFTHKIAIGSLGKFYRPNLSSFPTTPYLTPTPSSKQRWSDKLATLPHRPNIGISWIGGHKRTRIEVRSTTLEQWLPILTAVDANFISLQYTPAEPELAAFHTAHPSITIHHWPEACYNANYDETAGLVANLDLIITVCTSLVHLAGSMSIPTWVLTPSRPAWRYRLDLDHLPWYSNSTLFRQAHGSTDWIPVIAEVASTLTTLPTPQSA